MSYFALATNSFEDVVRFYGEDLRLPTVAQWDRPNGRGRRFDLGGVLLEILDNTRERSPLRLCEPGDRFHVVVEVQDLESTRSQLNISTPAPLTTTWGARLFRLRDPDGVNVTFLQWDTSRSSQE